MFILAGLASALPQAPGSQTMYTGAQQQQPYLATAPTPQFQAPPPPPGNMVQSHQQPQQQIMPPQNEAELISFD